MFNKIKRVRWTLVVTLLFVNGACLQTYILHRALSLPGAVQKSGEQSGGQARCTYTHTHTHTHTQKT